MFDVIIIGNEHFDEVFKQLTNELKISPDYIHEDVFSTHVQVRITALKSIAFELKRKSISGAVAELGVFRGEFAKYINEMFPDRILHLFDTFEGFDERDVLKARELAGVEFSGDRNAVICTGHPGNTSEDLVLSKMRYPGNCRIHKGYFPETTKSVNDEESYCFVNIDVDLYQPALHGLNYFYPRMSPGGVILLHDYNVPVYLGVMKAFDRFLEIHSDAKYVPIGDNASVAIVR